MGEIADMMLDGTLCEGCGTYMEGEGYGFPRYCSNACARDRGVDIDPPKHRRKERNRPGPNQAKPLLLCLKDARFLQSIIDGRLSKIAPLTKRMGRMVRRGFLEISTTFGPGRDASRTFTVTDAGRKAIKDATDSAAMDITF